MPSYVLYIYIYVIIAYLLPCLLVMKPLSITTTHILCIFSMCQGRHIYMSGPKGRTRVVIVMAASTLLGIVPLITVINFNYSPMVFTRASGGGGRDV